MKKQVIIIDGYNVIGNWPELAQLKEQDQLAKARDRLLEILTEYRRYTEAEITVVFDAMYVPGITQRYDHYNLEVVFTQQDETADSYIEKLASKVNNHLIQLTVVTSDQAEQWTVFSRGALRISSREFGQEIQRVRQEVKNDTRQFRQINNNYKLKTLSNQQMLMLEKMRDELSK